MPATRTARSRRSVPPDTVPVPLSSRKIVVRRLHPARIAAAVTSLLLLAVLPFRSTTGALIRPLMDSAGWSMETVSGVPGAQQCTDEWVWMLTTVRCVVAGFLPLTVRRRGPDVAGAPAVVSW